MNRLEAIARCVAEMEQCSEASVGAMIGWLDWYEELHRLLYETE